MTGSISVTNGGTGAGSFDQGWIYSIGGTNILAASTSPTVNYVVATSTTATSTFPRLAVSTGLQIFGTYGESLSDFCVAITGSVNLCDGDDATGGGGSLFGQAFELGLNTFSQSSLIPTTTVNLAITGVGTSTFAGGLSSFRQISAPYFQATSTTATSTFTRADITTLLNVTASATSSFSNGINLAAGCFSINGTCVGGSSGGSLQASYTSGSTIETAAATPVVITETTAEASTHNLLQLTTNPATGGTYSGDALQITMDAVDANANTGTGLRIVVDKSQATGNPIIVEDDAGVDMLALSQTTGLTIGSATARLDTTSYGNFTSKGLDLGINLVGIIDIYVYDTTKDAEGGDWRDNFLSQNLSWYTEAKDDGVNDICVVATDDRCGSSAFPRKAILITTEDALYIFDSNYSTLWMKFTQSGVTGALGADLNNNPSGVSAENGVIVVGTNGASGTGMYAIDFKQDVMYLYNTTNRTQGLSLIHI